MAFSNTVTEAGIRGDGTAYEKGTWSGASVTTGNITAGAGTNFPTGAPKIRVIEKFSLSSDGDTAVLPAQDVGEAVLKLTFTSSDTGRYYIEGPSAGHAN